MSTDICQWMVASKLAVNDFSARHIFSGLELCKVRRFWARVRLIILYRRWKRSGENTQAAYERAKRGERPPRFELPTTQECGHSVESIVVTDEMTAFCGACADKARKEIYEQGTMI